MYGATDVPQPINSGDLTVYTSYFAIFLERFFGTLGLVGNWVPGRIRKSFAANKTATNSVANVSIITDLSTILENDGCLSM